MKARLTIFILLFTLVLVGTVAGIGKPAVAQAPAYQPGDLIEYKVGGAFPEAWEKGTIIRELPGGTQYLIHEIPSQFFPEGPERAYALNQLRPRQAAGVPAGTPAVPGPVVAPAPVAPGGAADVAAPGGKGLLSKADILAYARKVFGPGDPHADSAKRDANNDAIRDLIKARGTSFKMDLDFSNALGKLGAFTVHISAAVNDNFGQHPKLQNYFGTFLLRAANRGTKSLAKANGKTVLKTTDAQYEAGSLTITRDGRYVWKVSRNDPAAAWVTGKWREATAAEKQFWEGGPSIVLEKARDGQEYTVRTSREKGYEKWIDVGIGKGRIAVNYGRPA